MEGLTYGGNVLSDHTQRCAGLPAQEEFVSVTCHVYDLLAFKGFSRWRHAREPEDDSTQDLNTIVVHGVHLHGDGDQITLIQASTDDLYAG